jgi:hypothetical protein
MIRYALVREAKGSSPLLAKDSHNFLDGMRLIDSAGREVVLPDVRDSILKLADDRTGAAVSFIKLALGRVSDAPMSQFADIHRRQMMQQKLERATAVAAGLSFKLQSNSNPVIPNSAANVTVSVVNSGRDPIDGLECGASPVMAQQSPLVIDNRRVNHATATRLAPGAMVTVTDRFQIPATAAINVPLSRHLYEATGLGMALTTRCTYDLSGKRVGVDLPIRVDVAPLVEITNIKPSPLVITPQNEKAQKTLTLHVINHQQTAVRSAIETVVMSNGPEEANRMRILETPLTLGANEKREVIIIPFSKAKTVTTRMTVRTATRMTAGQTSTTEEPAPFSASRSLVFRTIDKSSNEVSVSYVLADAHVAPRLTVGYIRGFDFSLPNALTALGVESKELSVDEVKTADLAKYTSIIVDNRVYESKPELIAANQKLLDYANTGGTLIVFYHKSDEWNPDERRKRPQLAPYKLILGNERVTDETAPITFLEPEHPLLNFPNKMGQEDFANWIQERGLYYPREWDLQFHALLQSNDPGEAPLKGGLLVGDYGKGHYIYTSMVWYRELRGGIPGAYRMLANMISYGKTK